MSKVKRKRSTMMFEILMMENVFIVLSFLMMAVGVYNFMQLSGSHFLPYLYFFAGLILLAFGIYLAVKILVVSKKQEIPLYDFSLESDEKDPETGLLYQDIFMKKAEEKLDFALTNCYLAEFQIQGIEHLRHFVGYRKSSETLAEIGHVFSNLMSNRGERYVLCGCKSGHEYMLMTYDYELKELTVILDDVMEQIHQILAQLPPSGNLTVYCGYNCYPTQSVGMEDLIKNAGFAVYEAILFRKSEPHMFSIESYKRQEAEYMRDYKLRRLLDLNELQYDFQPIVNAKTGKIFAYEALMRTGSDIGLSPTDVLELAERQDRLYEVEHYTFFNVLKIMNEHKSMFEERRLFINSIPTATIKENEFDTLLEDYRDVMKQMVVEITENGLQSAESCNAVHKYMEKSQCELALDDYGTGYSNLTSLLNNNPNYIKVDHSLVTGIDTDSKKQHLVANLISFAKTHKIKVLAEGVETPEELQMVIQLGVHLIQGFYTAKPNSTITDSIPDRIENEIVAVNLKLAKLAIANKVYEAANFDALNLIDLALDFYSEILITQKTVTITGDFGREVSMDIRVGNDTECTINLENVNLRGRDKPCVIIGENSSVLLIVNGDNSFSYEGISVPSSSRLILQGDGNLSIHVDHNNGIGIGAPADKVYGKIQCDMRGVLHIESNGDTAIGIGGFQADENSEIKLTDGLIEILVTGNRSLGIGAMEGYAHVTLDRCRISMCTSGAEAVGIGSFHGEFDITSIANIEIDASGGNAAGIGTFSAGTGNISVNEGIVNIILHSMEGVGIGTMNGNAEIYIFGEEILIYAEGSDIGGIGNYMGTGKTSIKGGAVKTSFLVANPIALGSLKGELEISGGNIFSDIGDNITPVNQYGIPVYQRMIESDRIYRKKIETEEGVYVYSAYPSKMFENIHVYLPKFCRELTFSDR